MELCRLKVGHFASNLTRLGLEAVCSKKLQLRMRGILIALVLMVFQILPVFAAPGVPAAPTVLFSEDFEGQSAVSSAIDIRMYSGPSTYTASAIWTPAANKCDGWITRSTTPLPTTDAGCNSGVWNDLKALAQYMALAQGIPVGATNTNQILSAYTNPGSGSFAGIQLSSQSNIVALPNRFYATSILSGAVNCFANSPILSLDLIVNSVPVNLTTGLSVCATGTTYAANTKVQKFISNALLSSGSSTQNFGVVLNNTQNSGSGNDGAVDLLQILDVTPQLDKAFSPANLAVGDITKLTFTITNTSDLAAKPGWKFTDNLPAGLIIAPVPNVTTSCAGAAVTATSGAASITVIGTISASISSCTVTVDLQTSNSVGALQNCPANISNLVGLNNIPACVTLTVTALVTPQPDTGSAPAGTTTVAIPNVASNDTVNGAPAVIGSNATVSPTSALPTGVSFNTATGAVTVGPSATPGVKTFTYVLCDTNTPQNCAPTTVTLTVVPSKGELSGRAFLNADGAPAFNPAAGDKPLANIRVVVVAVTGSIRTTQTSVITGPDGLYSVPNLPATGFPGNPDSYEVLFFNEAGQAVLGTPAPDQSVPNTGTVTGVTSDRIVGIRITGGATTTAQNLPLDPGGVVYDSVSRTPVAGAVVTIIGPPGFDPAIHLLGGLANVAQTTGVSGFYQYLLQPTAPPGIYSISVTPPAGYGASTTILPQPGSLPSQPSANGPNLVVTKPGVPQGTDPTTYYTSFVIQPGSADILHNNIPLDPLNAAPRITKKASKSSAELGDTVLYEVNISNAGTGQLPMGSRIVVTDNLPAGFYYITDTSVLDGKAVADPQGGVGPTLVFGYTTTVALGVSASYTLQYRVRVGVGALQGDGINRAQARFGNLVSNQAQAKVKVLEGVFASDACVAGKVFIDCNRNHVQDAEEIGIPGVRLYLEDGTYFVTDSEGKYSYCGLAPKSHVLVVDMLTMPRGSRLTTTSNRNMGDANSLFLDAKKGELLRGDFAEGSCSKNVLEQVKARRSQGEVRAAETEKTGNAAKSSASDLLRGQVSSLDYGVNAAIAKITFDIEKDSLPADGQSANQVTVRLFDKTGAPLKGEALITIEHSAGRIFLPNAKTDELGPGLLDADKVTPGVQLKVNNGQGTFQLLAPIEPTDLTMRITAGVTSVNGTVSYLPELREMVAAGLLEGIINLNQKDTSQISATNPQTHIDDGFERELTRLSRQFSDGKGAVGARSAFFIKGTIKGDVLLTAAFDSDKETGSRLLRDIDPNRFYPVYGDSSLTGFDARSRERLYVRLDHGKNYALYGDFSTGDGFSQLTGGGNTASVKTRDLGNYNRSSTGLRVHGENSNYLLNGFVFEDTQKQQVEEYAANGTSGPFSVRNTNAIENSEKVEILTRDKNARSIIKQVQLQQRGVDYNYEPFSGQLVFKSAVASLDLNGNPQSIRISYEVEQGGAKFITAGVDGQLKLSEGLEVGGSLVKDQNPLSPYQLGSANATLRLGTSGAVTVEVAQSRSTRFLQPGLTASPSDDTSTTQPTGSPGETRQDQTGKAVRLEGVYADKGLNSKIWYSRAGRAFVNPAASIGQGQEEAGVSADYKLYENVSAYGKLQQTRDRSQDSQPTRSTAALGGVWDVTDRFKLDLSVRHTQEDLSSTGATVLTQAAIPGNADTQGGGFFGLNTGGLNPNTGAPLGASITGLKRQSASSLRLAADYRLTERWSVNGEIEGGTNNQRRLGLGGAYQINERSKLYARAETNTGLNAAQTLTGGDVQRSTSLLAGIDNRFASGPTVYSEYRLRDAIGSTQGLLRDQQLASGVRNSWNYAEGITLTASAEYLKIFNGVNRDAFAITSGMDYSVDPLWRGSGRLEFRRVLDDKATVGVDDARDQYLSTVSLARKLDRDWTLLIRNYLLVQDNHKTVAGISNKKYEDRVQIGTAWRPVDHNRWNALARYEFKAAHDATLAQPTVGEKYQAHIVSLHGDYHPSRPWLFNGRVAAKAQRDSVPTNTGPLQSNYAAVLIGGRATYDFTENWDVSLMTSYMRDRYAAQWAQGAEIGYLVQQNLWLSVGANWRGLNANSAGLTGAEYTNKGAYLRLRFKFDADVFKGKDTDVNRALDR